jgi:uncharacterized protein (TIGR03437 family)
VISHDRLLLWVARTVFVLGAFPLLVHGYEFGPDPGYTGAPGDNRTSCIASGCHSGTVNSGPGNVRILLPAGNSGTYTPGQSMQLLVQITDATKAAYGFELTARTGGGNTSQAGDFSTADANTQVICADGSSKANGKTCPAAFPVECIEHTLAGYTASLNRTPGFTYTMNWTPPATDSGTITLYVAANAGPGNPPVQTPTNVYTSTLQLTPAAAVSAPVIDPDGVVPVDSSATTIQPGSWVSIYSFTAKNLANGTAFWNGDFPTSLGGVSVAVNGKPAYLWYVSPTQINLQAPDDTQAGTVTVAVTNSNGTGTSTVTLAQAGPAFLLLGDGRHATGIIVTPNGSGSQGGGSYDLLGPSGTAGLRPVKKGETLVLYGIGFGPTSPAVPAGRLYSGAASMVTLPRIMIGNVPVELGFGGIVAAGLYQFSFTVPANVGSGDQALAAVAGGVTTPANVFVPVQ